MYQRLVAVLALSACIFLAPTFGRAQSAQPLTIKQALQRALAANPRLAVAERDVNIAAGRHRQSNAYPNPDASFELDNALGSKAYRGTRQAETTLQLSQLLELPAKRDARIGAAAAELDSVGWQLQSARLEVISETLIAYVNVLSAQRRVTLFDVQIQLLNRLLPPLRRRVEAGASSPAEVLRVELAGDLVRAERERAQAALASARRELAVAMGATSVDFTLVAGAIETIGTPPPFSSISRAIELNPQLTRWTAVRAQRQAELIAARLKPFPEAKIGVGWRHYRDTGDNAVRLGITIPLPVWDQNQGEIAAAQQSVEKTFAEQKANKAALLLTAGKAYDSMVGARRELDILQSVAIPKAQQAVQLVEEGYLQGRFTLIELLDVQSSYAQAKLRELESLVIFHTAVATIEGLVGSPVAIKREISK